MKTSCAIAHQALVNFLVVDQLDLGAIKVKLMEEDEGEGWTAEEVEAIEVGYKRFLYLNLKYPEASIVPNKEIDTFWHYHTEVQRHLITYLDFALRETLGKTLKELLSENEEFEIGRHGLVDRVSQATTNQLAYDSWLKREGEELYTYRSLTELTELLEETSKENDFGYEIIEAYETERVEYSNFLKKISDTNLRDSKQNLLIKRTR